MVDQQRGIFGAKQLMKLSIANLEADSLLSFFYCPYFCIQKTDSLKVRIFFTTFILFFPPPSLLIHFSFLQGPYFSNPEFFQIGLEAGHVGMES